MNAVVVTRTCGWASVELKSADLRTLCDTSAAAAASLAWGADAAAGADAGDGRHGAGVGSSTSVAVAVFLASTCRAMERSLENKKKTRSDLARGTRLPIGWAVRPIGDRVVGPRARDQHSTRGGIHCTAPDWLSAYKTTKKTKQKRVPSKNGARWRHWKEEAVEKCRRSLDRKTLRRRRTWNGW